MRRGKANIAIPGDGPLRERRAIRAGRAPLGNHTTKSFDVLQIGIEDGVRLAGRAHDSVANESNAADQHIPTPLRLGPSSIRPKPLTAGGGWTQPGQAPGRSATIASGLSNTSGSRSALGSGGNGAKPRRPPARCGAPLRRGPNRRLLPIDAWKLAQASKTRIPGAKSEGECRWRKKSDSSRSFPLHLPRRAARPSLRQRLTLR